MPTNESIATMDTIFTEYSLVKQPAHQSYTMIVHPDLINYHQDFSVIGEHNKIMAKQLASDMNKKVFNELLIVAEEKERLEKPYNPYTRFAHL